MTNDKSLVDKAIKIQNKKYVLVSDRVIYFNETYTDGSIETELVSDWNDPLVVIKATVSPDGKRKFTGYSQATVGDGYINKTSALENAETSAVGRALAMMGIGVIESIASADELNKASWNGTYQKPPTKEERIKTMPPLHKAKGELVQEFFNKGVSNFKDQKKVISDVLGKETVDSIEEAEKVSAYLKEVSNE